MNQQEYKINVYRIWWDEGKDLYVGSTKRKLSARMASHRRSCRTGRTDYSLFNFIKENGYDFNYGLIKSYMVTCRDEQMMWEQYHLGLLKPNINKNRAHRSPEYTKQYQDDWRDNNRVEQREKQKIYHQKNKEIRNAKNRKYWQDTKEVRAIQEKKYRDSHKEQIFERRKRYRESHKEDEKRRSLEFRKKNKNMIVCHCGERINYGRKDSRLRHYNSKKHTKFQKLIKTGLKSL